MSAALADGLIATDLSEKWLPALGHEGRYEVSDQGRVRSLERTITYRDGRVRVYPGCILQPSIANGYRVVTIGTGRKGTRVTIKIAVLVLQAFVGPAPFAGAQSRHLNDIPTDDRLENLAWGSNAENMADKVRNNHSIKGVIHHKAKLTEVEVIAIRNSRGLTQRKLAEMYGVSASLIGNVLRREIWRHI